VYQALGTIFIFTSSPSQDGYSPGYTALMFAAERGNLAVLQALLEAGAAIDIKTDVRT